MIGTRMHRRCLAVLRVLESEGPLKRKAISERIGITSGYLDDLLANLHWQGKVVPDGKGSWHLRRGANRHATTD